MEFEEDGTKVNVGDISIGATCWPGSFVFVVVIGAVGDDRIIVARVDVSVGDGVEVKMMVGPMVAEG